MVLDAQGRILVVRVRRPRGANWDGVIDNVEREVAKLEPIFENHAADVKKGVQRTDNVFVYESWGVSMGCGQQAWTFLAGVGCC